MDGNYRVTRPEIIVPDIIAVAGRFRDNDMSDRFIRNDPKIGDTRRRFRKEQAGRAKYINRFRSPTERIQCTVDKFKAKRVDRIGQIDAQAVVVVIPAYKWACAR